MKQEIQNLLTTACPWRDTLFWYDTIDSTNTRAKAMAANGASHGTVLIAGSKTGGRGRMGRSFSSPRGMGVYLSVILRPNCAPDKLMHLTCAAAVAACRAVENASGISPRIKWKNDLVWGKQKLGGILTELSLNSATGLVEYAIIGIGINCCQSVADFPPELQNTAISVTQISGAYCSPVRLAAALTDALYETDSLLLSDKKTILDAYRSRCMTLGKEISVLRGDEIRHGTALDLDEDGELIVRFSDGTVETVNSGEVSIRGMYGYV